LLNIDVFLELAFVGFVEHHVVVHMEVFLAHRVVEVVQELDCIVEAVFIQTFVFIDLLLEFFCCPTVSVKCPLSNRSTAISYF